MLKKGALKKVWNVLSTVASVIVVYKQVNALVEASEAAKGYLEETDTVNYVNPLATAYSQKERIGTGV